MFSIFQSSTSAWMSTMWCHCTTPVHSWGVGQRRGRRAAVSPHAAGTVFPRNWKKKRTHSTNWCVPINEPNQRMNEWMNQRLRFLHKQLPMPWVLSTWSFHVAFVAKMPTHVACSEMYMCPYILSVCYSVRLSGRPSISACFPHSLLQIVHCQSATAGWLFHFSFRLSVRLS